MSNRVFDELADLVTEARNPESMTVDRLSTLEILQAINSEDKKVARAVENEIPYISEAVDLVTDVFGNGGRLLYLGAGTSGRLGVLDASECPPTYGTRPELIQGIIAGGYNALVTAQEGSEDRREDAQRDLQGRRLSKKDVVCGLAASSRTPYVIAGIDEARIIGAKTILISCTPREQVKANVDIAICPVVGPEVIMGSTRMKAATAQKLVLNMITTTSMIRMGKVYENMMVDLQMNSEKLRERSKKTVMIVTGIKYEDAEKILGDSGGHVKTALVMILAEADKSTAQSALRKAKGFVRMAIELATEK